MAPPPDVSGPVSLRQYFEVLWRRRAVIFLTVIVCIGGSVVYDVLKTPVYEATAQLQLEPQVSSAVLQVNNTSANSAANTVDVPTDSEVIESKVVADRVRAKLPDAPKASVSQVGTTDVVNVSVRSTNKRLAARAANLYAKNYIAIQQIESVTALTQAQNVVQTHVNALQTEITSLNQQAQSATGTTLQSLTSRINSLELDQQDLNNTISAYQTAASLSTGGGVILSSATTPTSAVEPKPLEYGILALIVGLIVGAGLAILRENLDDTIRSVDDLDAILGDVAPLGTVPKVAIWRAQRSAYLVSERESKSPAAEAYRSIRTSIQFLALERSLTTIQVTSPKAAEGKTSTIANLAVTFAQAGQRVIAVDCDLRRPRLHAFFELPNEHGFTSVLLGESTLDDVLLEPTGIENLRVMTSGPVPPNPSELLSSRSTKDLLRQLRSYADIVLIDSPPVLPVTDAVALAGSVEAVILLACAGLSTRKNTKQAMATLGRVNAPLAGFILNRALETNQYAYYRYTQYRNERSVNDGQLAMNGNGAKENGRPAHSVSSRRKGSD